MVLIDASTRLSHIYLLSTHNQVFAKLLVQFDNTGEIISHDFHEYCISIGIEVEHLVAHVHTQNRLAELIFQWLLRDMQICMLHY